jgi:hypothetical protein
VLIRPGDRDGSLLYQRLTACDSAQMPPLGRSIADMEAAAVIGAWIDDIAYRRRLWCAKGGGLAGLGLGAAGLLSLWVHSWFDRRQTQSVWVRGLANLPVFVAVVSCIAIPWMTREQGSVRFVLTGINAALGAAAMFGIAWMRRVRRLQRPGVVGSYSATTAHSARQAA